MMANGNDLAEVVKFLSLYTRPKNWCDDERDAILQLAITSCGVVTDGLCEGGRLADGTGRPEGRPSRLRSSIRRPSPGRSPI